MVWGLESRAGGGGYGYGKGYYGGYYSYADYYNASGEDTRRPSAKHGAKAEMVGMPRKVYVLKKSAVRRFAEGLERGFDIVLAVLAIVLIAILVVYFLDQAMGWGIALW